MIKEYQICKRCVMDTTDPDIIFNSKGVCNHCESAIKLYKSITEDKDRTKKLNVIVNEMKELGKNKKYDCIIGVSGGVDSTYVAYLLKELGLRPLAVHLDNGWNSELAVSNIEKALKILNIDLFTHVLDWQEFKDLQMSFIKASVPHCEHPTDHAIVSILYKIANESNVKYIIYGSNTSTESIAVKSWSGGQLDWKYIKSIQKRFGTVKLKDYPYVSGFGLFYYRHIKKIKTVNILDYVNYIKEDALKLLEDKLNWIYYGGKHYESIYTKFFQTYILPKKFNIDKRKTHLSPLICNCEITREEALIELKKEICNEKTIKSEKEYVIKKLGITEEAFDKIMREPIKSFYDYPSYENSWYFKILYPLFRRKSGIQDKYNS